MAKLTFIGVVQDRISISICTSMDWIRIKSLKHSFSSREKWPESELNERSRRV